ncbi:MAG: pyridoxamine 5'-phosphate oxidase family protein [Acidimicrobiia bacterium]
MATWAEFENEAPELAAQGREILYRHGDGEALIATVRGDSLPRVHPINVGITDSHLWAFIMDGSPKGRDLGSDGRYALHAHVDPGAPSEFGVRGRAVRVDSEEVRSHVAAGWYFDVDDGYLLFDLSLESALLGLRGPDEWPPRYRAWTASA